MKNTVTPAFILVLGLAAAGVGGLAAFYPMAALAAALVICGSVWLLRAPEVSIASLLFATTLLTRIRLGSSGVLLEQGVLVAVICVLILRGRVERVVRAVSAIPLPIWGFLLWGAVISILRSPNPANSLRIDGWMVASVVGASLIVTLALPELGRSRLVRQLLRLVGYSAAFGVVVWVLAVVAGTTIGVQTETVTGAPAAYAGSSEANIFGGICAIWLVVDLLWVREPGRSALLRRGALVGGLLVSLTRGAILGAVAGLLVAALFSPQGRRAVRRAAAPLCFLAVAFLVAIPVAPVLHPILEKGEHLVDFKSSTNVVRTQSMDLALHDLNMKSAVLGLGVNSFGQRHEDPSRPGEHFPGYLGNVALQVVYDTGFVGLALLLLGLLRALSRLGSTGGRAPALLVAGLVIGLATSPLWFMNWWVLVALGFHRVAARRWAEPVDPSPALGGRRAGA